ncbi:MAG: universal stress protein [Pseudomonadota bacterium]|nr:universal stress protein [Pseudomonadota bacterium]
MVAATEKNDCNLIIVGSHDRSGLDRLLMDSVSQQSVIQAKCPVLVAKAV